MRQPESAKADQYHSADIDGFSIQQSRQTGLRMHLLVGTRMFLHHCPPFAFVRNYIEKHGDRGELEAFQRSWCRYDWGLTYAMVDGRYGVRGHYERPHTLSAGDDVCDMRWRAEVPPVDDNN